MGTVLRAGAYRFIYENDREEPPHIYIGQEDKVAKFWLDPIRLQESGEFGRSEIVCISKFVIEYEDSLLKAWDEYFGG